ncbi:19367_t:CDS:2, partial [Funneliformis geosporum]
EKDQGQNNILSKRTLLTLAQKYEICFRKIMESSIKNKELAVIYNVSEGSQGKRQIKVSFLEIEEALTLWAFASLYKIENFKGGNDWIDEFKKRLNLSYFLKQGEAASAPLDQLDEVRKILQDLIRDYSLEDGILPNDTNPYIEIEDEYKEINENEFRKIQDLINKLEYIYPLTAEEYIRLDHENENAVTNSEALDAFDKIFDYLKQDGKDSNKLNDTYSDLVSYFNKFGFNNYEEDSFIEYQLDQNILYK